MDETIQRAFEYNFSVVVKREDQMESAIVFPGFFSRNLTDVDNI